MANDIYSRSYPLSYVANEMNRILADIITDYEQELSGKAYEITKQVANDFSEKLKQATPRSNVQGGDPHLADTVTVTEKAEKSKGSKGRKLYVHYGKWQIAHLLEFGWTLKNGTRIDRQPFIRPLFDSNKDRYYRMYVEGMKR